MTLRFLYYMPPPPRPRFLSNRLRPCVPPPQKTKSLPAHLWAPRSTWIRLPSSGNLPSPVRLWNVGISKLNLSSSWAYTLIILGVQVGAYVYIVNSIKNQYSSICLHGWVDPGSPV